MMGPWFAWRPWPRNPAIRAADVEEAFVRFHRQLDGYAENWREYQERAFDHADWRVSDAYGHCVGDARRLADQVSRVIVNLRAMRR